MACRAHGWRSSVCPECQFHAQGDFYEKQDRSGQTHLRGQDALQTAFRIIDARRWQRNLLLRIAREMGFPAALATARGWQDPMPLPVVICNFA